MNAQFLLVSFSFLIFEPFNVVEACLHQKHASVRPSAVHATHVEMEWSVDTVGEGREREGREGGGRAGRGREMQV